MSANTRRNFLQYSAAAIVSALPVGVRPNLSAGDAAGTGGRSSRAFGDGTPSARKPLRLGLIVNVVPDPEAAITKVKNLDLPSCQIFADHLDQDLAGRLKRALNTSAIEATALVTGGAVGDEVYDFYAGPLTLGIVPPTFRAQRIEHLQQMADFTRQLGIPALQTHVGFIPEDPNQLLYREAVQALREVVGYCRGKGIEFRYETGTESPITMLRTFEDVGLDNQAVNFDTANLILYGKANPLDALDTLGKYVRGMHAKDGLYPTSTRELGQEVPIGQGKVDFPRIIARLKEMNYQGAVTIEREISGPQQLEDVRKEKLYLEKLIG